MQTIDIKTTQNVAIEYELASLRERMFAFFIDLIIVGAIYVIIFLTFLSAIISLDGGSNMLLSMIFFFLPVGGFLLYQLLSEVLANGQSWGKRSMGIRVVRVDGREPGLSDYLLRAIFHLIDTLLSLGVIAALFISSSAKNQRLGDLTANTTVIRVQQNMRFRLEEILRIKTQEDYEPLYPEVQKLSEEDMLLIKNAIARYRTFRNPAHQQMIQALIVHLKEQLDIAEDPSDPIDFLKTLIRDYIVLTR